MGTIVRWGACVLLALAMQADLRSSLLVSMVTQLLSEDRVDIVRQAAVKSLAVIVTCVDDKSKFNQVLGSGVCLVSARVTLGVTLPLPPLPPPHLCQCWELLMRALNDRTPLVVSSAWSLLLPTLCAWAYQLDQLEGTIVAYFLEQTLVCIKVGRDTPT